MLQQLPKQTAFDKDHLDDFVCGDFSRNLRETRAPLSVSSKSRWLRAE
jgi:hypothetical protein